MVVFFEHRCDIFDTTYVRWHFQYFSIDAAINPIRPTIIYTFGRFFLHVRWRFQYFSQHIRVKWLLMKFSGILYSFGIYLNQRFRYNHIKNTPFLFENIIFYGSEYFWMLLKCTNDNQQMLIQKCQTFEFRMSSVDDNVSDSSFGRYFSQFTNHFDDFVYNSTRRVNDLSRLSFSFQRYQKMERLKIRTQYLN